MLPAAAWSGRAPGSRRATSGPIVSPVTGGRTNAQEMSAPDPVSRPRLRVVEGEHYADWESVYADNAVAVYRLVFRQVGNRPDAEDLAEEVFLAALPRLRLPAPAVSVRSYLGATVRSVIAEHWRRHYAAPPPAPLPEDVAVAMPGPVAGDGGGRALGLLARLPD